MPQLTVLSPAEQLRFDSPPVFTWDERASFFTISNHELTLIKQFRTSTNQVGFLLQLGYFKARAKFFTVSQFKQKGITYVANLLGVKMQNINFSTYQTRLQLYIVIKF